VIPGCGTGNVKLRHRAARFGPREFSRHFVTLFVCSCAAVDWSFAWPLCVFAAPAVFFARCVVMLVTARAMATSSATPATASGSPPRWIDAKNRRI